MTDQAILREIAEEVVARNNDGTTATLLETRYDPGCVSVESADMPGSGGREVKGLDAIRAKWDWWESSHEVHAATAEGPFLHGEDRFGVIFGIDVTEKASANRVQMRELGVYTVRDGRIVREEFFN